MRSLFTRSYKTQLRFQARNLENRNLKMSSTAVLYENTVIKLREISTLNSISGLLGWDEMVMMPDGSSSLRGKQVPMSSAR